MRPIGPLFIGSVIHDRPVLPYSFRTSPRQMIDPFEQFADHVVDHLAVPHGGALQLLS